MGYCVTRFARIRPTLSAFHLPNDKLFLIRYSFMMANDGTTYFYQNIRSEKQVFYCCTGSCTYYMLTNLLCYTGTASH